MENKIILTVFALMYLIGSISIAAAQVTKIGTGIEPAVYGSKVTWSDTAGSIHIYDLTTKKDTKISSTASTYPAIYGNKLVWHDESNGVPRITVYDIPSKTRSYITLNVDTTSIPVIYGNRIVWSANYNASSYNSNVYMRDIKTSSQTRITNGDNPDICDTKITYTYDNGDMPGVYVYDAITKKTVKASPYNGYLGNAHIYGNKVVWTDGYTRMGYISMYDINTKKVTAVTSEGGCTDSPESGCDTGGYIGISGDKIVYVKSSNDCFGNAGVYVYSIATAKSTQIFNCAGGLTTPEIYDNTIVWEMEDDSGMANICMCDLAAKPIASFTANKVSGTHSLPVTFTYIGTGAGTPSSYLWDFGDKTTSNHALTATHTYIKAGTYTVSLKVTNSAGSNTSTKTKYIKVN